MSDIDRWEFLVALEKSDVQVSTKESRSGFSEAKFLRGMLQSPGRKMSVKQQAVVDKMIDKYERRVQW